MAEPRHRENIQVFVRVRTINSKEKAENGYSVIDCCGTQEVVVRDSVTRAKLKTFTYDKVFNPKSKQFDVYKDVMQSHIEEVLSGYNCTVFAYGQTGTGKTYTMEGEKSSQVTNWQEDPKAGIIPRALSQIFDELQSKHSDYAIRVSFLELYNEELFDLLSPVDDTTKLRLFEDSSKKGSVIIKGLEEATVTNKDEVYKILEKGSAKRQTASTLMNAQSSRSHTIFSVTVHIREDDYVKVGKLNLVDLAGSENIGRSGAIEKRAREAGNINQSLLTLGRVITCLVERSPHIPYRESKLTRLLQDSLGGKTKTSIVATISPANTNIEETLSTLEYAHRAKNIQNKPEVNKVLTQKNILKEYNEQIERLKRDLKAVQDKSGIIISEENYQHMMQQIGSQEAELVEKMNEIKALEEERDRQSRIMEHFETLLKEKQAELENVNEVLIKTETVKNEITEQAKELQEVVKVTSKHTELLHDKLDRKAKLDLQNAEALAKYKSEFNKYFKELGKLHTAYSQAENALTEEQKKILERLAEKDEEITEDFYQTCAAIEKKMTETIDRIENLMTENLNKSIDWMNILVETMQEVYERENNNFIMYIEQTAIPLVFSIIDFKEKMVADVSQLEAVNNDGIDTMQLDSDMKREMLAQLKDDQVAVTEAIDAVGSQLTALQAKHHQLASNYDQQMMKTNQLMDAISESNKRKRQLYVDLVKQNRALDEEEKSLIESFTNFSSFMEEKMASFGEMIEDAERRDKETIEEAQRLCHEYETQIDDGRSLYMEDIVCYRRGIAEKLKSFTSSQADMISSSSQMISSIVSDGKSDLCELSAANEETKLLVDSVANKLHGFEEKLTAIQMLAQNSAEELVNMMKEHNSTSKETSEKEIKELIDGFDSFSSSLTNFLKKKLLVTPASGDTPKREDIQKITEEAGVEMDDVDTIPSNVGLLPPTQIPTFKEKENVKESKIGKANTGIPRTTRILEEINN